MFSLDAKILASYGPQSIVIREEAKVLAQACRNYQRTKDRAAYVCIKLEPIVLASFAIMISELA